MWYHLIHRKYRVFVEASLQVFHKILKGSLISLPILWASNKPFIDSLLGINAIAEASNYHNNILLLRLLKYFPISRLNAARFAESDSDLKLICLAILRMEPTLAFGSICGVSQVGRKMTWYLVNSQEHF